jgi:hypothetical protein
MATAAASTAPEAIPAALEKRDTLDVDTKQSAEDELAQDPDAPVVLSARAKKIELVQFASLCYALFLAGMSLGSGTFAILTHTRTAGYNDGTTGPLLPRMQDVYHVRPLHAASSSAKPAQVKYAVVSLIFIFNCIVGWSQCTTIACRLTLRRAF